MTGDPIGLYPNNANNNIPYYPTGSVTTHGPTLEGHLAAPGTGQQGNFSESLAGFDSVSNVGVFNPNFLSRNNLPMNLGMQYGLNNLADDSSISKPANDDVNSNKIVEEVTEEVEKGKGLFGLLKDDMFSTDAGIGSSGGPKPGLRFGPSGGFNPASTKSGGGDLRSNLKTGSSMDFSKIGKWLGFGG